MTKRTHGLPASSGRDSKSRERFAGTCPVIRRFTKCKHTLPQSEDTTMSTVVFVRRCWSLAIAGVSRHADGDAGGGTTRPANLRRHRGTQRHGSDARRDAIGDGLVHPDQGRQAIGEYPGGASSHAIQQEGGGRASRTSSASSPSTATFRPLRTCVAFQFGGELGYHKQEPKDGYDAIEWLARHPLCNGRVGTHGPSAMMLGPVGRRPPRRLPAWPP